MPKKTCANVEYLRRNGPATLDELPCEFNIGDKRRGVVKTSMLSTTGSGCRTGGQVSQVYYIDAEYDTTGEFNETDTHPPKSVAWKLIEANPFLLENMDVRGLVQKLSRDTPVDTEAASVIVRSVSDEDEWDEAFGDRGGSKELGDIDARRTTNND